MDLQKNKYGKFEKNTTFERIFFFFFRAVCIGFLIKILTMHIIRTQGIFLLSFTQAAS